MKHFLNGLLKEHTVLLSSYNAGLLQGKAYRVLNTKLSEILKPFDLTITEWKVLGQLCDKDYLQLNEVAKILEVEPPLITKLIEQLKKKGLVTKSYESNDRRVKLVSITVDGKNLISLIEVEVKKYLKKLFVGINMIDLLGYTKVLKVIASHA